MKRMLAAVCALVVLGCSTMFAQAKIEIQDGSKFDFGPLNKGTTAEKNLVIKNTGTETLAVGKVDVSCGCTGTVVSNDKIEPGKTGTIKITFNSQNFSGPVHKTVTINSNDPSSPRTVVEFTAEVIQEITFEPNHFWFRDAKVGQVSTVAITVTNLGKTPLELTGVKTQLQGFTLKLPEKPIEPGASAQLVAELKPTVAKQVLSDGVFVTTTNKAQPQLYIQIFGNIKEFKFE